MEKKAINSDAPRNYWKDKINRTFWVKELVAYLNKDPRDISENEFNNNGLRSVLKHCGESLFKALIEAFPEKGIKAWEMDRTPRGFFEDAQNRIAAVKWLCEIKLAKEGKSKNPRDVIGDDFYNNRLTGLLAHHYVFSPFKAISEAYPGQGIKEWEMGTAPMGFYEEKQNRIAAVRWLCEEKLALDGQPKDPRQLTGDDFTNNRMAGLLANYYDSSPFKAVSEAYPELGLNKVDMKNKPHHSNKKKTASL
ncbi:MAG: hypothetical protein NTX79_02325 [Candidatus Micrarchaeota archaeon]|nr:hypothetical protein [Candidatus Micrarchaeota archaeon]